MILLIKSLFAKCAYNILILGDLIFCVYSPEICTKSTGSSMANPERMAFSLVRSWEKKEPGANVS